VTNKGEQFVTVIDGVTNNTTTVNVGPGSCSLAVNKGTNKIYVGTFSDVVIIDGTTNNTTNVVVSVPVDVAVNSVTNKIYTGTLVGGFLGNLTVIDGATNSTTDVLLGKSYAANQIGEIAIDSGTNRIYASLFFYHGSWVANIEGASLTVKSIANGDMYDPLVGSIAVNPTTNKLYVPHSAGLVSNPTLNQTYVLKWRRRA
jgi:hypothetical protein